MSSIAPQEAWYWRSLEELARQTGNEDLQTILANPGIAIEPDLHRRKFLALIATSLAAAGVGCGRFEDRGEIVGAPALQEGELPGIPRYYASTLVGYPGSPPILATVREGRVVKLEGNPEHPISGGSLGSFGQAATLDLYDPDRLRAPLFNGNEIGWAQADQIVRDRIESSSREGKFVLLITAPLVSPTARSLVRRFTAAYPKTLHLCLATFHEGERLAGSRLAFGLSSLPSVYWEQANVILNIDCDFLGIQGSPGDECRFLARRRPEHPAGMNRLWTIEAGMTSTGANSDHRFPLKPSLQPRFLVWLLGELVLKRNIGRLASDPLLAQALERSVLEIQLAEFGISEKEARALVDDLVQNQAASAVLIGPHLPTWCQVLVAALNVTLGNLGSTILPRPSISGTAASSLQEWNEATELMENGRVGLVISLGANPVYALPEIEFGRVLAKVPFVVTSSLLEDETAAAAHLRLPAAHDLECWGDSDFFPNLLCLQQPTMRSVFQARQNEESLLCWLAENERPAATYRDFLQLRWRNEVYPKAEAAVDFTKFWEAALHDGFIEFESEPAPALDLSIPDLIDALSLSSRKPEQGYDVVLCPSSRVYDGRFANNGWLQELPHPVTTQTWGNAAIIGPSSAMALECKEGQIITIKAGSAAIEIPVLVEPGVAAETVLIDLGYGRTSGGSLGSKVGVDAGRLRSRRGGVTPWLYTRARLFVTPNHTPILRVQGHSKTEGRSFIKEVNAGDSLATAAHTPGRSGAGTDWEYKGHKWGLVVDLSACTGCGACTIACVAENNIPVVGPDEVAKGREMHWIRVDRYFSGTALNPTVSFQPMMCQQCDYAPCEKVCPVAATVHSPEGLDEMIYNRCVGTRYCANNCPYKVRRFNYFDYHKDLKAPRQLAFNPEVTIRSRGVMEKCTFCVQRIAAAKMSARSAGRQLADGDIQTACQQACPARAIVFGDLNDPESRVHQLSASARGYRALDEFGIGPSVTYLARVRNPHPELKI
ncbi:MAG TPA: 4Fe-4S dicluster domain-containing protein [Acidobacteriota bacterium]|nr:4Fe-4S dicluster domain-containing protein [Acidobacteriota bacterium]